jgi:hypothetical protein
VSKGGETVHPTRISSPIEGEGERIYDVVKDRTIWRFNIDHPRSKLYFQPGHAFLLPSERTPPLTEKLQPPTLKTLNSSSLIQAQ